MSTQTWDKKLAERLGKDELDLEERGISYFIRKKAYEAIMIGENTEHCPFGKLYIDEKTSRFGPLVNEAWHLAVDRYKATKVGER